MFRIAGNELPDLGADGLHTYLLVRDLIEHRGDVVWQCTTNFYFFPALAFVAFGEALFDDLGLVHLAAFAAQALAIALAGLLCARVAAPRVQPREWWLAATSLTCLYLAAGIAWPFFAHTSFMPTSHGMHFPVAILVLALFLVQVTRPSRRCAAAFVVLGALLLLSDVIFLPWLFAPLAIASFAAYAVFRRDLRRLSRAALLLAVPFVLSVVGKLAIEATGRFNRRTRSGARSLEQIPAAFEQFLGDVSRVEGALALALVSALVLVTALALLASARRARVREAFARGLGELGAERLLWAGAITAAALLASAAVPLATGAWESRHSARYFASLPFFCVLWLAYAALAANAAGRAGTLRAFALASVALGAAGALRGAGEFSLAQLLAPYPARIAALDALAVGRGLRFGLADYAFANEVRALSRAGLRVVAIDSSLRPYVWSTSADVYFETQSYDFVIVNRLEPALVERRLGPPRERLRAGALEVWRYDRAADAPRFVWFRGAAIDAVRRRGLLVRDAWTREHAGAPAPALGSGS